MPVANTAPSCVRSSSSSRLVESITIPGTPETPVTKTTYMPVLEAKLCNDNAWGFNDKFDSFGWHVNTRKNSDGTFDIGPNSGCPSFDTREEAQAWIRTNAAIANKPGVLEIKAEIYEQTETRAQPW